MLKNILPLHEMLPWDRISLCAHTQEFPLHNNPHSKDWNTMVFTIHTSIIETQVMIFIEIHAFDKVIFVPSY
jgi:hypothetical protein